MVWWFHVLSFGFLGSVGSVPFHNETLAINANLLQPTTGRNQS